MAMNNRNEPLMAMPAAAAATGENLDSAWGVYSFGQASARTCNSYGELGHDDTIDRNVPMRVAFCDDKRIVDVACGNEQTVLLCESGDVYACGYNDSGQCGTGATVRVPSLRIVSGLTDKHVVGVFSGNGCEHLAALTASGSLFTVGFNGRGQLGLGSTLSVTEPAPVLQLAAKRVVDVACSYFHTAAVTADGELWTCGRNDFGQLGLDDDSHDDVSSDDDDATTSTTRGGAADKLVPHPVRFFMRHAVLAVACGQHHTIASLCNGGVVAFGKNEHGQLGIGAVSGPAFTPTRVVGPLATAVVPTLACGYYHSIAVTQDGAVFSFGRNDYGQLGLGHTKHVATPTRVHSLARVCVVQVACGCYHTLALSVDGKVYPFGRNNHGQLGLESSLDCLSPQLIPSLRDTVVRKVAAGFYHSVCLVGNAGSGRRSSRLGTQQQPARSLGTDLRRMLNNRLRSDVTFVLEGDREFAAHCCIVIARCEPLEKMLDGRMNDGALARIVIPEYSFDVFAALMEFLYTDEVAALAAPDVDAEFLLELLALADQYLVTKLCRLCESALVRILSVENASLLLQTAHFRDAFALKRRCLNFMLDRFGDVIATDTFVDLPPLLLQEVLLLASRHGVVIPNQKTEASR